ncbi:MAG TPA: GTP-binding protein, partial [Bryobacteraceae bacterium]|nr:GTP-binding protein [Bryobacteraceae bacterium]
VAGLGTIIGVFLIVKLWQMWRRTRHKAKPQKLPSAMTRPQMEREIATRQNEASEYLDAVKGPEREQLAARLSTEREKLTNQTLEIVAFGTISSGKSSLLNALIGKPVFVTDPRGGTTILRNETEWQGHGSIRLVDTPGLGEMHGADRAGTAIESARSADLILYVTDGVLRDFEYDVLRRLTALEKRIVVCLNKEDTFSARDRDELLNQMRHQLRAIVPTRDFVPVRANPTTRTRVRVTSTGEEVEEQVIVEPDVSALADRMMEIIDKEGPRLLLANLLIRARGLVADTKHRVRDQLEREARELVGRYMWQAGGAAALSPFPLLDVAAGLGISYKMVVDIAGVFRQQMDLDSAREMVAQAGKNLLTSAGMAIATPSIATLAASALKTIPGVGTIAGGAMQGMVQALVTRWIGMVFIAYFRDEMTDPARVMPGLAKEHWAEVTRPSELARLVQEGIKRFGAARRTQGDGDAR